MILSDDYIYSFEKKIIEAVKDVWGKDENQYQSDGFIYVFHGLIYGFEFCLHENLTAKGLQKKENLPIISISYLKKRKTIDELDRAFGILESCYVQCGEDETLWQKLKCGFWSRWYANKTYKNKDKLFGMSYRGISCGESVHDEIVRYGDVFDCFDVSKENYRRYLYNAILLIDKACALFKKHSPKFIVTTECVYLPALFIQTAQKFGSDVVNVSPEGCDVTVLVKSKFEFIKSIKTCDILNKQIVVKKEYLKKEEILFEDDNLFIDKDGKKDDNLLRLINITNKKKNIFLMPHAITDASRTSYEQKIFHDYNEWLIETLDIIKNLDNVNWILKDHPASNMYGQGDYMKEVFLKKKTDNLYWCDKSVSGLQIKDIADAVVTCASDVGVEYWAFGIPTITTARTHYTPYGISYMAKTKEEYASMLAHIEDISKPTAQSRQEAYDFMAAYNALGRSQDCLAQEYLRFRKYELANYKKRDFKSNTYRASFARRIIPLFENRSILECEFYNLHQLYEI